MNDTGERPKFTVFIPTYNRAHTLDRLFRSLLEQTYSDFEIIIVDDGSTDRTADVVAAWTKEFRQDVRYVHQPNAGKPTARNLGVSMARGELFKTVDSDDILEPACLEVMWREWTKLGSQQSFYAGIVARCATYPDREPLGGPIQEDRTATTHAYCREVLLLTGDRTQCVRTDLMREFPFPAIQGEKFISESYVWNRIGLEYPFLFINSVLKLVEYQSDGLSSSPALLRSRNPRGCVLYYREYLIDILPRTTPRWIPRVKAGANLVRFAAHGKTVHPVTELVRKMFVVSLFAIPLGLGLYLQDLKNFRRENL